jgi:sec-independent protein translocase protein TatA
MGELSPWHWAIVIIALVVLFGARRLPDAARSLGRSARILKSELRAKDDPPPAAEPPATTPPPAPTAAEQPPSTDSAITTSQSEPRHN